MASVSEISPPASPRKTPLPSEEKGLFLKTDEVASLGKQVLNTVKERYLAEETKDSEHYRSASFLIFLNQEIALLNQDEALETKHQEVKLSEHEKSALDEWSTSYYAYRYASFDQFLAHSLAQELEALSLLQEALRPLLQEYSRAYHEFSTHLLLSNQPNTKMLLDFNPCEVFAGALEKIKASLPKNREVISLSLRIHRGLLAWQKMLRTLDSTVYLKIVADTNPFFEEFSRRQARAPLNEEAQDFMELLGCGDLSFQSISKMLEKIKIWQPRKIARAQAAKIVAFHEMYYAQEASWSLYPKVSQSLKEDLLSLFQEYKKACLSPNYSLKDQENLVARIQQFMRTCEELAKRFKPSLYSQFPASLHQCRNSAFCHFLSQDILTLLQYILKEEFIRSVQRPLQHRILLHLRHHVVARDYSERLSSSSNQWEKDLGQRFQKIFQEVDKKAPLLYEQAQKFFVFYTPLIELQKLVKKVPSLWAAKESVLKALRTLQKHYSQSMQTYAEQDPRHPALKEIKSAYRKALCILWPLVFVAHDLSQFKRGNFTEDAKEKGFQELIPLMWLTQRDSSKEQITNEISSESEEEPAQEAEILLPSAVEAPSRSDAKEPSPPSPMTPPPLPAPPQKKKPKVEKFPHKVRKIQSFLSDLLKQRRIQEEQREGANHTQIRASHGGNRLFTQLPRGSEGNRRGVRTGTLQSIKKTVQTFLLPPDQKS